MNMYAIVKVVFTPVRRVLHFGGRAIDWQIPSLESLILAVGVAMMLVVAFGVWVEQSGITLSMHQNIIPLSNVTFARVVKMKSTLPMEVVDASTLISTTAVAVTTKTPRAAAETQSGLAQFGQRCDSRPVMHEYSSLDFETVFNRRGPPLQLADVFVVNCDGADKPHADSCKAAVFIFNVKVFEFENGTKLAGAEKQKQFVKQSKLYRLLTEEGTLWECVFSADEALKVKSFPLKKDKHLHSLSVTCPIPQQVIDMGVGDDGRLKAQIKIQAILRNTEVFSMSKMNACAVDVGYPERRSRTSGSSSTLEPRREPPFLAACTMITELDPKIDTITLVQDWVDYMLHNKVEHILLYVDASHRPHNATPPLEAMLTEKLSRVLSSGEVQVVLFHLKDRGWLETQQMMETHCIHRYKGWAKWVIHDDIDEFIQPLSPFSTIKDAVVGITQQLTSPVGGLQVKQSFWGHLPDDDIAPNSSQFWNMRWRSSGPYKGGREKLILNVSNVDYISVHTITTGGRMQPVDPYKDLRLNHFRRHFKALGAEDRVPSWRNSGIGPHPVKDDSFRSHCARIGLPAMQSSVTKA